MSRRVIIRMMMMMMMMMMMTMIMMMTMTMVIAGPPSWWTSHIPHCRTSDEFMKSRIYWNFCWIFLKVFHFKSDIWQLVEIEKSQSVSKNKGNLGLKINILWFEDKYNLNLVEIFYDLRTNTTNNSLKATRPELGSLFLLSTYLLTFVMADQQIAEALTITTIINP